MGCLLEYDLFGIECSHYQVSGVTSGIKYICVETENANLQLVGTYKA